MNRTIALPLEKMSLSEKMGVMEDIWLNISHEETDFSPPDWHERVLEVRNKRVELGEIGFTDWATAKTDIRNRVS